MSTSKLPPTNDDLDTLTFSFGDDTDDTPDVFTFGEQSEDSAKLIEMLELLESVESVENAKRYTGFRRWFVPGSPFSIENLPKHKAWFAAGASYRERYFSASNRTGKTVAGAYEVALHATG